jgi:serine phosphatase RsbU (regulator of sigma subunit)
MPELTITLPDGRVRQHRLTGAPATIGRDLACEIAIDDPSTSRRHARLVPTEQGYYVEDLGSRNGTLVNDEPCTKALLKNGDRILVGAALAVYRDTIATSGSVVIAEEGTVAEHRTHYVPRDARLALSQRRLEMIYELSERLTTLQSQSELFENAMSICVETLHFERGAIGIRRPGSRAVDWPVVRNLRGAEGELTISRSLLSRALEYGERAMYTEDSAKADPTVSMVQHGIRSAVCVPLIHGTEILGVIYGDRTSTSTVYTPEDADFLAAIARQLSIGLVNSRLLESQREMALLERDLEVARNIQKSLFPTKMPQRPGLSFGALNDAGRRVSGDYYDVIERPDGRIWFLVADVTGEGVAAALLMANLQAAVRVTAGESDDPGVLLTRWNQLVHQNSARNRFITGVLALLDPAARSIRIGNAGHFDVILMEAGQAPRDLETDGGLPLGVSEGTTYESRTIALPPGPCTVFSFTDGIVEARNAEGGLYERARLIAALAERPDENPQALVKRVRKDVANFAGAAPQSDDITILAARLE